VERAAGEPAGGVAPGVHVAAVEPDWKLAIVRRHVRSLTVELRGASWGAVGFAVAGELVREPGEHDAETVATDAESLVARLTR